MDTIIIIRINIILILLIFILQCVKSITIPLKSDIFYMSTKDRLLYKKVDILKLLSIKPNTFNRKFLNNVKINIIDRKKYLYQVCQNLKENAVNITQKDTFAPFMAGTVGGMAEWIIGHPLDTIRVRVMSDKSTKSTLRLINHAITNPFGKNGFLSLYRGSSSEILSSAFTGSFIFGCTNFIRKSLTSFSMKLKSYEENDNNINDHVEEAKNNDEEVNANLIIASAATGLIDGLSSKPFEMIKSRQQIVTSSKRLRATVAIRTLLEEGGLSTFFRGWFPTMLRDSLGNAAFFVAYQTVKNKISKVNKDADKPLIDQGVAILLAGAAAGFAYVIVSHPFETMSTLMQIDIPELIISTNGFKNYYKYQYTGMSNCFNQIIKKNGIQGLYRGAGTTLLRAIPSYALSFFGYEITLQVLEKHKTLQKIQKKTA